MGELFANGSNHLYIEPCADIMGEHRVYYHDNFVFGHIFMFLTSMFAHFCILCTYLVGKQQEAYGESNRGMLLICWHMPWS